VIELNTSLIWYLNSVGEEQMSGKMGPGALEGLVFGLLYT